jgi:hypothetical protein
MVSTDVSLAEYSVPTAGLIQEVKKISVYIGI